jgi:prolyl 4-hydroxylase
VHHDYIESGRERPTGPRILTAFLYLNDVEEGGGTRFSDLDLTVIPKRGRLLLWPSVLNENPSEKDFSTHHQALKVEKGIKFAANAWIHLRDFKGPHEVGCS